MLTLLEAFFVQFGYAAVFFVLMLCGFGVPIPEDITLAAGGVISGLGYANAHLMVVVGMIGVLAVWLGWYFWRRRRSLLARKRDLLEKRRLRNSRKQDGETH